MIPQMTVVADLKRGEDYMSLKPGYAVGDCHARTSQTAGGTEGAGALPAPAWDGRQAPPPSRRQRPRQSGEGRSSWVACGVTLYWKRGTLCGL